MLSKIVIDPVTRIEGHLKIEVAIEDGVVKDARASGTLYRGLELMLRGRHPLDAPQISQRICGVCPTSHSLVSALALEDAFGITDQIPRMAILMRNLIIGAAHLADHILHFYLFSVPDYANILKIGECEQQSIVTREAIKHGKNILTATREGDYRFNDRENQELMQHYIEALKMRRTAQEMAATFGGKMPHNAAIVVGGVTEVPSEDKITAFGAKLEQIRDFINDTYLPDILLLADRYSDYLEIGAGCENVLDYGGYASKPDLRIFQAGVASSSLKVSALDPSHITEHIQNAWYCNGVTPDRNKEEAYSWIKAPRYNDSACQVGPLARIIVNYALGDQTLKSLVDPMLARLKVSTGALFSVMGRHIARAIESKFIADLISGWLSELKPGEPVYVPFSIPDEAIGVGLGVAARGAVGHWVKIKGGQIEHYNVISPTTWNMSPRDDRGRPGPVEQAIIGLKVSNEQNPYEISRVVRSFDPCLACAVH